MGEYICPHCKRPIYDDDAILCHFCGENLKRAGSSAISKLKFAHKGAWWMALALLILLSFIMLYAF